MSINQDQAIEFNIKCRNFVTLQLSELQFVADERSNLVFAYIAMMLEHQEAIIELVRLGLTGSALALIRSQLETACRGLWVNLIADDAEIKAIHDGKKPFPKFKAMIQSLDKTYAMNGFLLKYADHWKILNGFAHSGTEQLYFRFSLENHSYVVAPSYPANFPIDLMMMSSEVCIMMIIPILETRGFRDQSRVVDNWYVATRRTYPDRDAPPLVFEQQ